MLQDCLKQDRGNRAEAITRVERDMGSTMKHRAIVFECMGWKDWRVMYWRNRPTV